MRMKGLVLLKLDEEQPAEIAGCLFVRENLRRRKESEIIMVRKRKKKQKQNVQCSFAGRTRRMQG